MSSIIIRNFKSYSVKDNDNELIQLNSMTSDVNDNVKSNEKKYKNGIIYEIKSLESNKFYIGVSTYHSLKRLKQQIDSDLKRYRNEIGQYKRVFDIIENEKYEIIELKTMLDVTNRELRSEAREIIEKYENENKLIVNPESSKEELLEQRRQSRHRKNHPNEPYDANKIKRNNYFENAVIYEIKDLTTNNIYVGSTGVYTLEQQRIQHEGLFTHYKNNAFQYYKVFDIIENQNYEITELIKLTNVTKEELKYATRETIEKYQNEGKPIINNKRRLIINKAEVLKTNHNSYNKYLLKKRNFIETND